MKQSLSVMLTTLALSMPLISAADDLKDDVSKILKENPSIIIDLINENPGIFMDAIRNAAQKDKELSDSRRGEIQKKKMESAFANPLKPLIRKDEAIRGKRNAPLTIVEYSDFQCPYCVKGNETVQALLKKYKGKIQFIYKHLPLSFHDQAHTSAQYYEAIRMQSDKLAFKFHDEIFKDNTKLRGGEKALKAMAKNVGVNMKKLSRTLKDKKEIINKRIEQDVNEARKFGIQGTPGFLVNGIPVKGAYPVDYFEGLIQQLKERKLVKL